MNLKKTFLSAVVFASLVSCSPISAQQNTCIAELSDKYSIDLNQCEKWCEGIQNGYFSAEEFDENFEIIANEKTGFDTGVYFDAVLCWFFNGNRDTSDDWNSINWYSSTDSECKFVSQYDIDYNSIYGEE